MCGKKKSGWCACHAKLIVSGVTRLPHFLHPYNGATSSAGVPVCGSPQDWVTILESTGLGLVSFFLCGVACPAVALSLVTVTLNFATRPPNKLIMHSGYLTSVKSGGHIFVYKQGR